MAFLYYDWNSYYFSFIPMFRPQNITVKGPKDFVYQIQLTDDSATTGGFFGFWGPYPFKLVGAVNMFDWTFDHIRVHYPAEHTFESGTVVYDMEMQLFHNVSLI